jgi:trans-aconitate 2-methyltransferase
VGPHDWDAATYDRVSDAHARWGATVLDRLTLRGDETVLDAGCGSGRVTEQLLARLPRGRVLALDASPKMLAEAARRLQHSGERVAFVHANLAQPLVLDRQVDAILSTATFHWLADHEALFRNLAAVLRPGGQLVAQCGGAGCIASVETAIRAAWPRDDGWPGPWHFATAEQTQHRLEAAGFVEVQTWLHDEPTPLEPGEPLETFLETVILGAHLDRLPEREHDGFVRAVAAGLPYPEQPVIDYVRLNIVARHGNR